MCSLHQLLQQLTWSDFAIRRYYMASLHCFLSGKPSQWFLILNCFNLCRLCNSINHVYGAIAPYLFGSVTTNALVWFVWADVKTVNRTLLQTKPPDQDHKCGRVLCTCGLNMLMDQPQWGEVLICDFRLTSKAKLLLNPSADCYLQAILKDQ